jgi:hypothetical protein
MTLDGRVAASYAIVIPPGWLHTPAGTPLQMIDSARRQLAETADDGWVPAAGSRFEQVVRADEERRLLDAYLTAGPLPGTAVSASITVARVEITEQPGADPDDLLLARVARGAEVCDVGGAVGVLWSLAPAEREDSGDPDVRLLDRTMVLARVPGHDDFLLTIVLSVVTPVVTTSDEFSDAEASVTSAVNELFRALVTTFRWLGRDRAVISPRAREPR